MGLAFQGRSTVHRLTVAAGLTLLSACSSGGGEGASTQAPPSPTPPPATTNPESETDVIYGSGLLDNGVKNLLLDIYQPDGACTDPRPFVIFIHGGAFRGGSKSTSSAVVNMQSLVERGFVGISIAYRLVGDEPLVSAEYQPILDDFLSDAALLGITDPTVLAQLEAAVAAFEDTVFAIEWARDNAIARCLDIDNFGLWGSSAGAITALHTVYGLDEYFIDRPDPRVVVDYWGQLFQTNLLEEADTPFFILHGTDDLTVPYSNAERLAEEADTTNTPYAFYTVDGGPHGFANVSPANVLIGGREVRDVTVDFIEAHLTGGTPVYETVTVPFEG